MLVVATDLLWGGIICVLYGTLCVLCIIFTFFIDTYLNIDEKLQAVIIPARRLSFLEKDIDVLDQWLKKHRIITGPFLILLSLVDLKFSLDILRMISL
jgi:hypothetical protein